MRDMYNHKMVILNTTYVTPDTPSAIRDWLDLISESMNHPYNPKINKSKPAIAKAARLAEIDNVSPEELADAKIQELRKETAAFIEGTAREEGEATGRAEGMKKGIEKGEIKEKKAIATNMFNKGMAIDLISELTGLSVDELNTFLLIN
jgi:predicted transposase/invertase (TIGR01784 family)